MGAGHVRFARSLATETMNPPDDFCAPAARPLRDALERHGLFTPHQAATRRWSMGCVSLEVTQRCNLDCSLCYLSEHSEAVLDFPLEEIYRRIDMISAQYGLDCDVQISGGDPTLRDHAELELIVRRIADKGMRSSLFTNGILASRALLQRLQAAGLSDVAFHVDMSQERKGYATETALNALRLEYIDRARGLGLSVFFNTTVFETNVADVPMMVRFFAEHSDVVRLASFQMQADTGRGLLAARPGALTQARMMELIEQGAGTALNWDALVGGHPRCNRYATALVLGVCAAEEASAATSEKPASRISLRRLLPRRLLGGAPAPHRIHLHDLFEDGEFIARAMRETAGLSVSRAHLWKAAAQFAGAVARRPCLAWAGAQWLAKLVWGLRPHWGLALQGGGPRKISYFIHNFMDARDLDPERIDTCVFMAAGPTGMVPMCEFNAQRDAHLLRPLTLANGSSWQPLRDTHPPVHVAQANAQGLVHYPIKYLKGRSRRHALSQRSDGPAAHKERHALEVSPKLNHTDVPSLGTPSGQLVEDATARSPLC